MAAESAPAPKGKLNKKLDVGAGISVGGKVPKGCSYIRLKVRAFKRALDDAVLATGRDIDVVIASLINQACQWHRHLKMMEKLLADAEDLTPGETVQVSREVAKAAAERDRSIAALGLAVTPPDADDSPWSTIDADFEPLPPPDQAAAEAADEAATDDAAADEEAAAPDAANSPHLPPELPHPPAAEGGSHV